ncbi:MAG: flagellar biosynthetic protein FliR [Kofleriaceae bacterium]
MTLSEPELGAIIAALCRATALAMTAPVISEAPVRARLVFVLAIAFGVGFNRPGVTYAELPATASLELAMGLITGMTARFVMARVAIAGQLVGLSLGLGFASQYDIHSGESAGTLRMIFTTLASLAFLAMGGLEEIVRSASASPSNVMDLAMIGPELVRQGTSAFGHGLALAGPVVLAALIGNIGLAVLNRAAPAVNVFSISLSAVLVLGGLVLIATSTNLIGGITDVARDAIAALTP